MSHVNIHQKKSIAEEVFNNQMDKNNIFCGYQSVSSSTIQFLNNWLMNKLSL